MTRLAGTEEWSQEAVFARIKFEQNVARGSVPVLMEMAAGHNYANPELVGQKLPSDAIFAEGRAAEIAFATDNFDLGVSICRRLVSNEQVGSRTPMQFVFKATVGALLGVRRVYLRSDGVTIKNADVDHSQFYAWNEIEPMQLETMIRH